MIYAKKLQGEFLYKLSIYYFNKKDQNLTRIEAEKLTFLKIIGFCKKLNL